MTNKYSVLADILGRRPRPVAQSVPLAPGDVFYRKPDHGPIEYAQVIGVYEEEARIAHVRSRLFYRYQDKTAKLGKRTLAADLFGRRFPQMATLESSRSEAEARTSA